MPAFAFLKLTNTLACVGSQSVYGVLHPDDLAAATDVQAVEDQESLSFRYARVDATGTVRAITAQMRAGRVIAVVWDDGTFDEWRVGTVTTGRGEKGRVTVQCVPLWLDLVERSDSTAGKGWVSDITGSSVRNYEYELTQRTPSSILSTYVIPNCPSYVTLGTVDPTFVIPSLSVSRLTPGALTLAVRDTLRNVDVPCEVRLRRNGTTDYKLDLVTQIGASANTPIFHPSNALLALQQKSDPTRQATRVLVKGGTAPDGNPGQWGVSRWRCAAPSGLAIALTDRNGGPSPIAFDGQFAGMFLLRVKTGRTFLITASNAAAGTVTLSSTVSTIAADEDVEFRLTEPLTNTRTTTTRSAISAVPDSTHITCAVSNPITQDGQYTDWSARVWSLAAGGTIITTTRISGSVAATDVIAVASSASVTTAHFVEFVQLDGAGEVPAFVDHPVYAAADPVGYGIKVMELAKPMAGVTQLCPSGWMRTWTNGANPPDGWSRDATAGGAFSRNSNTAFTRYGGFSWKFNSTAVSDAMQSPPIYVTDDHGSIAVRCLVYYTLFQGAGSACTATLTVYPLLANGTQGSAWSYSAKVDSLDTVAGLNPRVSVGTWIELKIAGVPINATAAPYGIGVSFQPSSASSNVGYLDTIEVYGFSSCPNDPVEFGDAVGLLQAGNNTLRDVAAPPLYYTFTVRDLERTLPGEYARLALTLGGNVRAADVEYGIDATVRLLRRDRDLLIPEHTTLTLANKPTLLTNTQSETASTQQRVIAAITRASTATSSSGPAFVSLPGATTLTVGAEISTPTGAPVVTLPTPATPVAGVPTTGAAVTFVPPATTTPTVTITVGTPPSRQHKFNYSPV